MRTKRPTVSSTEPVPVRHPIAGGLEPAPATDRGPASEADPARFARVRAARHRAFLRLIGERRVA